MSSTRVRLRLSIRASLPARQAERARDLAGYTDYPACYLSPSTFLMDLTSECDKAVSRPVTWQSFQVANR